MALILDIETTGFPDRKGLKHGQVPDYKNLTKYEDARIVQFTMMICNENFDEIEIDDFIVKTDGFKIPNSHIHGITEQISIDDGYALTDVIAVFQKYLKQCSHIFAHNIDFDIPIIKSELYRIGFHDIIKEIDEKTLLCTMKHTKNMVNIKNCYGVKYPTLKELYKHVFNTDMENAHNSKYDVINLHLIIKKLFDEKKMNYDNDITHYPLQPIERLLDISKMSLGTLDNTYDSSNI